MLEQLIVGAIFLGLFAALAFGRLRAPWVFGGAALLAYLAGLVATDEVLQRAANPGLVTLVLLLLVSVGLERVPWLGRFSDRLLVGSYRLSLLRAGAVTAFTSAFLNNTAVVAALTHTITRNRLHLPSRLLLPLSYAAILGGTSTLIGTSTNLIVSSFLQDVTGEGIAFFAFLPVGVALVIAGLLTLLFFSRLLPSNPVEDIVVRDYVVEVEVAGDSPLVGRSILENGLRELEDLFLVELVRDDHLVSPVAPSEILESGDKLIFSGDISKVAVLERYPGLRLFAVEEGLLRDNMTEVIVLPGATVEGRTIKESGFRSLFDAAVVGMRRGGKRLSGKLGSIELQAGDSLMLAVGLDFASRRNVDKNFLVVDQKDTAPAPSTAVSTLVMLGLATAIAGSALGLFPLIKGLLVLLAAMLLLKVLRPADLRRRFPFELWIVIGAALVLSQALYNTGLVFTLADLLRAGLADADPRFALAGIYLATLLLTELMTNNAAAALVFPVAYGLARSYGLDPMPFVMAVAYGASASFLTPYGYATNLMVQNLGGYGLRDYLRYGLPLSLVYSAIVLALLPRVFPLSAAS